MLTFLLTIAAFLCILNVLLNYNEKARMMMKIPGPKCNFLIGNALAIMLTPVELMKEGRRFAKRWNGIYRLYMYPVSAVNIYNPEDVEIIVTSMKHNEKSALYTLLKPWLGDGLLVSNGRKWQQRRKILTPTFHFNILRQFFEVFEENVYRLLEHFNKAEGKPVDVVPVLTAYTLHTICETAMGTKLSDETTSEGRSYKEAILELGYIIFQRGTKLFLYSDLIFYLTSLGRRHNRNIKTVHSFSDKVIQERTKHVDKYGVNFGEHAEEDEHLMGKRKVAMLDLLITAGKEGLIDKKGIQEEVNTFMFEGHDTTASGLTFCFMVLANHSDIQDKIMAELNEISNNTDRQFTINDLPKMKYLECCIKESLRLYPPVHFISRNLKEPVKLSNYEVPAGVFCHIHILDLHRRPDLFENPEEFIPERFLPENSGDRHPYAYIPFSAGPRNCIGQKFALMEMKLVVAMVLREFRLLPVTRPSDIEFTADLVLRNNGPVQVKFVKRETSFYPMFPAANLALPVVVFINVYERRMAQCFARGSGIGGHFAQLSVQSSLVPARARSTPYPPRCPGMRYLCSGFEEFVMECDNGFEKWRNSAPHFYAVQSLDMRLRQFSFVHNIDPTSVREGPHKNADDVIFDMFKNEDTGLLPVGKFLAALRTTGIRKNDTRVKEVMHNLYKVHKESNFEGGSPETLKLDRKSFKEVIAPNIVLITRAFRSQFVIPDFQDFIKDIEEMYWAAKSNSDGKVASYIPQLARASSDSWGVSVCTIDGQRFSIGDVNVPFTLQSCSKPLTYAMALETLGPDVVHKYVGTEPSGRNFNELVLDYNMKPHNPMINAGAILVCSLLKTLDRPEMTLAEKFDYVMSFFSRLAGNEGLSFNNAVFLSEREAADRNYALGFYMREYKCYPEKTNLRECMDFYFQCCSMEANCDIMSIMAATLANGGICPITDEKVLRPDSVRNVLSLMHSCGMYDYSGQFAFKVGLPAKSGVSGAMLIVVPNVMGICTWSPPLDPLGNSCRGLQFCDDLIKRFNFHKYDNIRYASHKKDPRRYKFESTGLNIVNLLFSAASGDLSALRRHHLSGMDMTLSDYDGRTALHLAAAEGHLSCVDFLLAQCGVPHDPRDRWGSRPLNEAETFGHIAVVQYLKEWEQTHPLDKPVDAAASTVDEILEVKPDANDAVKDPSIQEIVSRNGDKVQ